MWNSLGSLRDRVRENANRVRENAKAAAQVAQGVLQAAAAEDEQETWDENANNDPSLSRKHEAPPPDSELPPLPPLDNEPPPLPPTDNEPPPPLPADNELAPPPPMDNEPPPPPQNNDPVQRAGRTKGRYVVQGMAPKPLRPAFALRQSEDEGGISGGYGTSASEGERGGWGEFDDWQVQGRGEEEKQWEEGESQVQNGEGGAQVVDEVEKAPEADAETMVAAEIPSVTEDMPQMKAIEPVVAEMPWADMKGLQIGAQAPEVATQDSELNTQTEEIAAVEVGTQESEEATHAADTDSKEVDVGVQASTNADAAQEEVGWDSYDWNVPQQEESGGDAFAWEGGENWFADVAQQQQEVTSTQQSFAQEVTLTQQSFAQVDDGGEKVVDAGEWTTGQEEENLTVEKSAEEGQNEVAVDWGAFEVSQQEHHEIGGEQVVNKVKVESEGGDVIRGDEAAAEEKALNESSREMCTENQHRAVQQQQNAPQSTLSFSFQESHPTSELDNSQKMMSQETAQQIEALQAQLRDLQLERDAAVSQREASSRENDDLKRSIMGLKDELSLQTDHVDQLTQAQRALQEERDQLATEKLQVETERDAAIEQGGDGIREATNLIQVMRTSQDVADKREAAISEQIEMLRADLYRISEQKNALMNETEGLKQELRESKTRGRRKEEELQQQLQDAVREGEVVAVERERALRECERYAELNKEVVENEQTHLNSVKEYEGKIERLEDDLDILRREREDEGVRMDVIRGQMEDMKERVGKVVEERDELYEQTVQLQKTVEEQCLQADQVRKSLMDATHERTGIVSERDEARQRCNGLRDQLKDVTKQLEMIVSERDELIQQRTTALSSSESNSEKERQLAEECQRKTAMAAMLQKKLTAAAAKIEKVTLQRATFQRQRDEAGARLRAAGSEFANMNEKLETLIKARDELQMEVGKLRTERDEVVSRVQELNEIVAQKRIVDENLETSLKQVEELKANVDKVKNELVMCENEKMQLKQKQTDVNAELEAANGKYETAVRERELMKERLETMKGEMNALQERLNVQDGEISEAEKNMKAVQVEIATVREEAALEKSIAQAELTAKEKIHEQMEEQVRALQTEVSQRESEIGQMRNVVVGAVRKAKGYMDKCELQDGMIEWPDVNLNGFEGVGGDMNILPSVMQNLVTICELFTRQDVELVNLKQQLTESEQRVQDADTSSAKLAEKEGEIQAALMTSEELRQQLEVVNGEKTAMDQLCATLQDNLTSSDSRVVQLQTEVEDLKSQMQIEMDRRAKISSEELNQLQSDLERVTSNLKSIWTMLQKSLGPEQMEMYSEDVDSFDPGSENIGVMVLRATASIVAELGRNRAESDELEKRIATAEAEVARLVDRAEIAEQERDAIRGKNERLEKKAKSAFASGEEEAQKKYEDMMASAQDELEDVRHELSRASDKAVKAEKEAGELRALCSKLTSQVNGRTNELDEAEEKLVYLQDQVTSLEEDLEEAHIRLKASEAETEQARKHDVERLNRELQEAVGHAENLEKECARLREECDGAKYSAKESELLAETHRKAEENLQIAIEQLEAAQESAVEQRTIELQKKLEEAEDRCEEAKKREEGVASTENKLSIRDDEIKELRGALGRLADERVELKLELEKSLSRLNHPDAGGQLVDRRVVRQLLVSYFRVGSVRRRDVLELMSRMLAFSDSDNIAVGLKRRALMDRLGSLVQAPEPDDASLPPLGTVSDKWIEFLMQETEEEEEESRGW